MTTIRRVSNSEIQTRKRCRRKHYLSYYLGFSTNDTQSVPTGPANIGIIVHEGLEAKYGHGEDPLEVIDTIYAYHKLKWTWDPKATQALEKDYQLARRMVEGYLEWIAAEGLDSQIEILDTEKTVTAPSRVDGVEIVGKLDVRVRDRVTGFRAFMDHKTVGSLTDPLQTIEISEQFPTYGLLEQLSKEFLDDICDGGYINMLKRVSRTVRANPPFYARHDIKFNNHQLNSMWRRINSVIIEILDAEARLDRGEDHRDVAYPTPAGDCSWSCPFLKICPLMDDGSRWKEAVEGAYVRVDPYARYSSPSLRVVAKQALIKVQTGTNDQEGSEVT